MTAPYWIAAWIVVIGMLSLIAAGKPDAPMQPMTMKYCPNGPELPCPSVPMECKTSIDGDQVCTGRLIIGQENI